MDIIGGMGGRKFDVKAVFQRGASLVRTGIDLCPISSFTHNP